MRKQVLLWKNNEQCPTAPWDPHSSIFSLTLETQVLTHRSRTTKSRSSSPYWLSTWWGRSRLTKEGNRPPKRRIRFFLPNHRPSLSFQTHQYQNRTKQAPEQCIQQESNLRICPVANLIQLRKPLLLPQPILHKSLFLPKEIFIKPLTVKPTGTQ